MRIFLAPMEGVVDYNLRKIYAALDDIDFCVTEFIRVNDHNLPARIFTKNCPELIASNRLINRQEQHFNSIPIRVQLLGSNPSSLANNAVKACELGAIGIDLNFGCPAKTVNKSRGGACLLDETSLIEEIVRTVRNAVPIDIPVTAKIRLGYNDRHSYLDNALAIERAGANELFVHARSKVDGYKPPAYWSLIGDIKAKLSIPVIANGEIWNVDDFKQCQKESQCDDFMLGRGLLANPNLASEIRAHCEGLQPKTFFWNDTATLLHQFFIDSSNSYPSKFIGNRVKQWLHYLQLSYPEAKVLFETIKKMREFNAINDAILESMQR